MKNRVILNSVLRATLLWVCAGAAALLTTTAHAQRQMERLGRGVVAMRATSTQVYIGWRLLATDPDSIGFNLYRAANGGTPVKLNSQPLTNTTDYVDTPPNLTVSNAWFVRPVPNGVEQAPSASYGLPANAATRRYFAVPLQAVTGGAYPPYDVKFCWVGDFDGDGEYDFLVDRLSTTGSVNQYLQAYLRDGTFLWQMDMGYNSTNQYSIEPGASAISVGDKDNVTVYDLDGDGRAEVIVRVARGTVLPNGTVVAGPDDTTQYLYVLDGLTGEERAHATIPNPFFTDGPLGFHFGILYCDGIHPSVVLEGENRIGSGSFNEISMAWDFKDGVLSQRWQWTPPSGGNYSRGHQIRIADVNHDGIDDLVEIGSVNSGFDGQPLFDTEIVHGDRCHITDIDPDHPGLETFVIQQDNPTLLATALYESATGKFLKKWYAGGFVDVGRGIAIDIDPNHKGCELYSTQPGIFDCKGNQIFANNIWPPEGVWWDADLSRELEDGANSGATTPVIEKFNPSTGTAGRVLSIYNDGVHQAYGGRAAFWGDIFGDWREELVLVANDYSEIRIYTTTTSATNRLYCLMQDPAYRAQATVKGYYEANYPDYYLGTGMQPPPPPPISDAKLVWRGGGNEWDVGATANWLTNNLWISNTTLVAFTSGDTVLFDMTGSNNTSINLSGALAPGVVTVHSPKDYTFGGTGSLTGTMKLTKAGGGKLTLSGTNTFTGATTVWEGPLVVNGILPSSPVTVRSGAWLDAALCGHGSVGGTVTLYRNASISPGAGVNSPGTLTLSNGLVELDGAFNRFDLSDDPTGMTKTNDRLNVIGNVILSGTNTIYVSCLNTNLAPGLYQLITYSGSLLGGPSNLVVDGIPGVPVTLTNPPGEISLLVKSTRAPATITWTGGVPGNTWDLVTSSNWLNGAARDTFVPQDNARFDNAGATNPTVNLAGTLLAGSVVVNSSSNYTFNGAGAIAGSCSLTKSNTGTLTVNTLNWYTGPTFVNGGTVAVSKLDALGFPSPLGNPGASSTNLVLGDSSTLRVTGESFTDRGMTLNSGTNTIDVYNAADQVTIAGQIIGSGALQKLGLGTLALTASNSYSAGTLIRAGSLSLGGGDANQYALGTGLVTLDNGTLSMFSDSGSYDKVYWNVFVPAGATGTLNADARVDWYGSLAGGGTLNFYVPYVRTTLYGNWSPFTGRMNVSTDADGGDFRVSNSYGYANAAIYLGNLVVAYHVTSGTAVSVGELSGSSSARLAGAAWTVGAKSTDSTFAGNIAGNSITKVGTGTWTLTGSNYYTGTTIVSAGRLLVNGNNAAATGALTVNSAGTLGGTGVIGGPTTVNGTLSPGASAGVLTFNGNVTLAGTSTTLIEIGKSPLTNDLLRVLGTLICGGTLVVTNISGVLEAGDSFQVLDAAALTGAFGTLNLPLVKTGLVWNTSGLYSAGTLSITTTNLPPAPANLIWKGDGAANFWDVATTANWLNGATSSTFNQGDAVLFNDVGSNNMAVSLTGLLQPSALTVNAFKDYTFGGTGSLSGTNSLVKSGAGRLTLTTTNSFSGGVVLSNGMIALGSASLNTLGLGTGSLTFMGGTLQFAGYGSSSTGTDWGGNTNPWIVPFGQTGTVLMPPRFGWGVPFTSRLIGGGTLNIVDDYVRCGFAGDWSAFTGQLQVGPRSGTCEFRINNGFGYANAAFYLSNGVTLYNINGNGLTIDLGELAGSSGATLGTGNGNSSNPNWRVGARNTDAIFAGRIVDAGVTAVTKSGTGTWILAGTNTYSGPTIISNGTLLVNGALGAGLVTVYGKLGGCGALSGPVAVQPGGVLAPGASPGILTISNTLTLLAGSTTLLEVSKSPVTNDSVRVTGAVAYGGTLVVTNVSTQPLGAGDHFQLFIAGGFTGAFAGTNFPALDAGLSWNTNRLAADGTLWVVSTLPPLLAVPVLTGTNLGLSASGGTPGWPCYLLASTNLAAPLLQWSYLATNQFDAGGNSAFTVPIIPSLPERFYRLQVP